MLGRQLRLDGLILEQAARPLPPEGVRFASKMGHEEVEHAAVEPRPRRDAIAREPLLESTVAPLPVGREDWIVIAMTGVELPQQFADGLHVVLVKVRFRDLRRVLGGEDFDFDHKAVVVAGGYLFPAKITHDMQHKRTTLP